jgi:hypothetical protein
LIDLRHHIYSLAAVFLALAIGILIGTSFAGRSPAGEAGRRTIQRYEGDMRVLKHEILKAAGNAARKEAALKACEQYCRAVMPLAVKDRLYWRNVAVIQTGDYDDLTGSVKKVLEMAGAQVTCTVDISDEFPFEDDARISQVLANNGLGSGVDLKADRDKFFRILADTISTGKYPYLASVLEKAGVAAFGGDCDRSCKMVVIVGGATSDSRNIASSVDAQLLARFDKLGVTAVGCEPSDAASSYVPVWHKSGIATVDDADCAMGQTCLVYALNGETANFGTKPTADRLIPKSLESE